MRNYNDLTDLSSSMFSFCSVLPITLFFVFYVTVSNFWCSIQDSFPQPVQQCVLLSLPVDLPLEEGPQVLYWVYIRWARGSSHYFTIFEPFAGQPICGVLMHEMEQIVLHQFHGLFEWFWFLLVPLLEDGVAQTYSSILEFIFLFSSCLPLEMVQPIHYW